MLSIMQNKSNSVGKSCFTHQVVFSSADPEAVDLRPPPWLADPDWLAAEAAAATVLSSAAAAEWALPALLTLSSLPPPIMPSSGVEWWRGTVVSTCKYLQYRYVKNIEG